MVHHHLREVLDLCDYRVTGIGAGASQLAGMVFDAAGESLVAEAGDLNRLLSFPQEPIGST